MRRKSQTETKILNAAKEVFMAKGLEATSMSDIAEVAKISRPSLHYYFRTKENLFWAIYKDILEEFMPALGEIIRSQETPENKVRFFVEGYVDLLAKTPLVPQFVFSEIYRDPESIAELFFSLEGEYGNISYATKILDDFAKRNKIKDFNAFQFCLSLYGQCVFPFLTLPVLERTVFKKSPALKADFVNQLKAGVIRNALRALGIES